MPIAIHLGFIWHQILYSLYTYIIKIICGDYVRTKIGTIQSYFSSISDKKYIGGCGIAAFLANITQINSYMNKEIMLYILISEISMHLFYRKLVFNKIQHFKIEYPFKHKWQKINYDMNIDDNQFPPYNCDSTIIRYAIDLHD